MKIKANHIGNKKISGKNLVRKLLTYSLKFPFNFREDICVKQTEDTFAPAVTSLYINAKGIDKSEKAQEQVIFQWKKNQIKL